jgi:hypothetical protein
MMVASWLPWHISIRKGIQIYVGTVMSTYGMPTLLLGLVALIAGLSMVNPSIPAARLLARLSALGATCIGVYHLVRILTVCTPHVVRTPAIGLYVLGIGVLLAVVGLLLQRAASAPRRVG